jgi:phage pi2 protein 07
MGKRPRSLPGRHPVLRDAPRDPRIPTTVLTMLKDGSDLLRRQLSSPFPRNLSDEDDALIKWMQYLGTLTWTMSDAIVCLCSYRISLVASMLQRQIVEYSVTMHWFVKHPSKARDEWAYTAKEQVDFLRELGKENTAEFASADEQLQKLLTQTPVLKRGLASVKDMLADLDPEQGAAIYTSLIRTPSQVLHGTGLGTAQVIRGISDSSAIVVTELPIEETVALFFDQMRYLISFGRLADTQFQTAYTDEWDKLERRLERIELKNTQR